MYKRQAYGLASHCKIYEDFVKGAKEGLKIVVGIMPTLVALMIAVGVLRSSGFLDFLEELFLPVSEYLHFPAQLLPLSFIRMFSSSAATGLVLDIFKNYGTDSYIGPVSYTHLDVYKRQHQDHGCCRLRLY